MIPRIAGSLVYLDSNILMYLLRGEGTHFEQSVPLLTAAQQGEFDALIGDAVVAEVMVGFYRSTDLIAQQRARAFLTASGLLTIRHHDTADFDLAARLRATHGFALLDALHVATAMNAGCSALITNDKRLGDINGLDILQLADVA